MDFTWDKKKYIYSFSFPCRKNPALPYYSLLWISFTVHTQKISFLVTNCVEVCPHTTKHPLSTPDKFHSIPTLSTWSKHQIAEVKGSIPRDCTSHPPCFWPTSYRLGVPMTRLLGFDLFVKLAHRTEKHFTYWIKLIDVIQLRPDEEMHRYGKGWSSRPYPGLTTLPRLCSPA